MNPSNDTPLVNPQTSSSDARPDDRVLSALQPGETGVIRALLLPTDQALRFIELGLAPGEAVRLVRRSPLGDPIEVEVMGVRQGIRLADAARIRVDVGRP